MGSTESDAGESSSIRWIYPIVGGIIAESLTIAVIALIVAVTGHGGAGPNGESVDPIAQKIGAVAGATVAPRSASYRDGGPPGARTAASRPTAFSPELPPGS